LTYRLLWTYATIPNTIGDEVRSREAVLENAEKTVADDRGGAVLVSKSDFVEDVNKA